MARPPQLGIRELLLAEIKAQQPKDYSGPTLQQNAVLDAVAQKLNAAHNLGLSGFNEVKDAK
jgi:hypothetical protein